MEGGEGEVLPAHTVLWVCSSLPMLHTTASLGDVDGPPLQPRELGRLGAAPEAHRRGATSNSTDRGLPQGRRRDQDSITAPQAQWVTEDANITGSDRRAWAMQESKGGP